MSVRDADTHKLMYHPKEVANWAEGNPCYPLHVEIGITNRCNHKCVFCTLDWVTHGHSSISKEKMFSLLEEMSSLKVQSIYLAGEGEPTLHESFPLIVKKANEVNIKVAVSTNGSLMSKEVAEQVLSCLAWIRFSVDSKDPKVYSQIHGVKETEIKKVLSNIQDCVKIKKENNLKVQIGVQALLMTETLLGMEDFAKTLRDIGVDNFQIKPAHSHPKSSYAAGLYAFSHDQLQEKLQLLETKDFAIVVRTKSMERLLQPRNYEECYGFHFYGLIDAKGDVVPCNVFYNNPEFIYGNINTTKFKEIWDSEWKKQVVAKITNSHHCMCGEYRCRLDVMNRYLKRVKSPEINDEFI